MHNHNKFKNSDKLFMLGKEVEYLKDVIKLINKENEAKHIEILENSVKLLQEQVRNLEN